MNILPGVLATNLKELEEQLSAISWAKKIHLDIMDGEFVPNKTVQAKTLAKLFPKQDVQVHLMCNSPEKYVNSYAKLGAKEFIVHAEAFEDEELLERIRLKGMKSGIAFNPETKVSQHKDRLVHADTALIMTVQPGFSGGKFIKAPLKKIAQAKKRNPLLYVGVDGGCGLSTCKTIADAGADFSVATSSVTKQQNAKKAYRELLRASNQRPTKDSM